MLVSNQQPIAAATAHTKVTSDEKVAEKVCECLRDEILFAVWKALEEAQEGR